MCHVRNEFFYSNLKENNTQPSAPPPITPTPQQHHLLCYYCTAVKHADSVIVGGQGQHITNTGNRGLHALKQNTGPGCAPMCKKRYHGRPRQCRGTNSKMSSLRKRSMHDMGRRLLSVHAGFETCFDPSPRRCCDAIAKHISNPDAVPV